VFIVVYAIIENVKEVEELSHEYTVCAIFQRARNEPTIHRVLSNPCSPWGLRERQGYFYHIIMRDW
jgi:hypothetical protein